MIGKIPTTLVADFFIHFSHDRILNAVHVDKWTIMKIAIINTDDGGITHLKIDDVAKGVIRIKNDHVHQMSSRVPSGPADERPAVFVK